MSRNLLKAVFLVSTLGVLCYAVWMATYSTNLERLSSGVSEDLVVVQRAVEAEIDRFYALQTVALEDQRIRNLVELTDAGNVAAANDYLHTVREKTGASELYVMNADGVAVASSNWMDPISFVGQNYSFRPYFRGALDNGEGRYYAVGITSGVPGYFLARRLETASGQRGVLVVKIDMAPLERVWQKAGVHIAIADRFGVIFLSGIPSWSYRPLKPLSGEQLDVVAEQKTYAGLDLSQAKPLFLPEDQIAAGLHEVDGTDLMFALVHMNADHWTIVGGRPANLARESAGNNAIIAGLFGLILAGLYLFLRQHRQMLALRAEQNVVLENRVAERTIELAKEIEERKRTEQYLRTTQQELIQAAKLAVLGQMSAAIAHEVSQPLMALETTLAAGLAHAKNGAVDKASDKISVARSLTRRMQSTIRHLRSFARKDKGDVEKVSLNSVIKGAIDLAEPRSREVGVTIEFDKAAADCVLEASSVRLEQVVLNVLLNALDAVEGMDRRQVKVSLVAGKDEAQLWVTDTGVGISREARAHLTEPFFSTKEGGESLGLGLSISSTIVRDFGGSIDFMPNPGGGTICSVRLPFGRNIDLTEAAQ